MSDVKPIPENYSRMSPYLAVQDAMQAMDFYKKIFGFEERMRMPGPAGKIMHAEMQLGDSVLMLADEFPEMGHLSPKTLGGSPVTLSIYVKDADEVVKNAQEAGAKLLREVADQFYGDRAGMVEDPFGHRWHVATHVEDVPPEEMMKRMEKMGQ